MFGKGVPVAIVIRSCSSGEALVGTVAPVRTKWAHSELPTITHRMGRVRTRDKTIIVATIYPKEWQPPSCSFQDQSLNGCVLKGIAWVVAYCKIHGFLEICITFYNGRGHETTKCVFLLVVTGRFSWKWWEKDICFTGKEWYGILLKELYSIYGQREEGTFEINRQTQRSREKQGSM